MVDREQRPSLHTGARYGPCSVEAQPPRQSFLRSAAFSASATVLPPFMVLCWAASRSPGRGPNPALKASATGVLAVQPCGSRPLAFRRTWEPCPHLSARGRSGALNSRPSSLSRASTHRTSMLVRSFSTTSRPALRTAAGGGRPRPAVPSSGVLYGLVLQPHLYRVRPPAKRP